jgi:hypothetical protein
LVKGNICGNFIFLRRKWEAVIPWEYRTKFEIGAGGVVTGKLHKLIDDASDAPNIDS